MSHDHRGPDSVNPDPATDTGWTLVRHRARLADTCVAACATLLAASSMLPLFQDGSWAARAVLVVAAIAVTGAVARGLGFPTPLVPVAEGLALLLSGMVLFAGSATWLGLIPTTRAWDLLLGLLARGQLDAESYGAPVPVLPGLALLAAGGVGLAALAVDSLFVTLRMPVMAGVPLLALYLVPGLILAGGPPWWTLPLAAAGWLMVLAADHRDAVRRWGGLPSAQPVRGLATTARRLGIAALAVAALATVLIPGRSASYLTNDQGDTGTEAGTGTAAAVIVDPLVSMRRSIFSAQSTPVLDYRTTDASPSYLRVSVLENFDGTSWLPREGLSSGRDVGVALPSSIPDAPEGNRTDYDISVTNLQSPYLPLPFPVAAVDDTAGLPGSWRLDPRTGIAESDGSAATGLSYRATAVEPTIDRTLLAEASAATGDVWPMLSLPSGLDPRIAEQAATITAKATTPYERAVALQRWFTRDGGFRYSTDVASGASSDYIAQFLDDRVGYCEQFAGAMAMMARTLGIPSRVAVGFTQGAQDADGVWKVTAADAHAWPELWFGGAGWVRFEPTPRSGGTLLTPDYARSPDEVTDEPLQNRLDLIDDARGPVPQDASTTGRARVATVAIIVTVLVLLVLLVLALPMLRRIVRRRRRLRATGVAAVEGAWSELEDLAVDLGQSWSPTRTPRQAADRLARGMRPQAAEAVQRLRREVEQVRYARPTQAGSRERGEAVRADLRTVMSELRGRVRWQTRVAAYCWPSSERRRQRSSMRSMKPGPFAGPEDGRAASASLPSAAGSGRAPNAE